MVCLQQVHIRDDEHLRMSDKTCLTEQYFSSISLGVSFSDTVPLIFLCYGLCVGHIIIFRYPGWE